MTSIQLSQRTRFWKYVIILQFLKCTPLLKNAPFCTPLLCKKYFLHFGKLYYFRHSTILFISNSICYETALQSHFYHNTKSHLITRWPSIVLNFTYDFGGGGGSRTHVRKSIHRSFSVICKLSEFLTLQ